MILVALLIGAMLAPIAPAATRKALLVGINRYDLPPVQPLKPFQRVSVPTNSSGRTSIRNLSGAVADVTLIQKLLVARFGFRAADITSLTDNSATAEAILGALERILVTDAERGDVRVFFYAGHGSRILNKASRERDGLDETLVPADTLHGVPDIRDKELARIFRRSAAKGVRLTVIMDSCFSGSIARDGLEVRMVPPAKAWVQDPGELDDAGKPLPSPEDLGVLVLSAAQDDQSAKEAESEAGPHGIFTIAFARALLNAAPREPIGRIFARVVAAMETETFDQTPVLAGKTRAELDLLGFPAAAATAGDVQILDVGPNANSVVLQGGFLTGLVVDAQLRNRTGAVVRVQEIQGPMRATGTIVSGSVRVGESMTMAGWPRTATPLLRVRIPPGLGVNLRLGPGTPNDIVWLAPQGYYHYILERCAAGGFAWVSRNPMRPIPLRTACESTPAVLEKLAIDLARIHAWFLLSPPAGADEFPYELQLRMTSGDQLPTGAPLVDGQKYKLYLKPKPGAASMDPRFVYVFVIDSEGARTLLFPPKGQGSVENRFPMRQASAVTSSIPLTQNPYDIQISAPFGVDTYFLITTEQPFPDPEVLSGKPVRTRGENALADFLSEMEGAKTATRGLNDPGGWSIDRVSFRSVPAR